MDIFVIPFTDDECVDELEYGRLGLPAPYRQIPLVVPVELAAERAQWRADEEADRARDAYERDSGLQQRTAAIYAGLAAREWFGHWSVIGPDAHVGELLSGVGQRVIC